MLIIASKIIFIASTLGILFIVARKLPALSHLPEEPLAERVSFKMIIRWPGNIVKKFFSSNFFQNVLVTDLEKSLRKFKIAALKIYNIMDKFIEKLKGKSGNGMPT